MHGMALCFLKQGGPGPKSCHAMCFIAEQGALYVLGGFVEAPTTSSEQESSPQVSTTVQSACLLTCRACMQLLPKMLVVTNNREVGTHHPRPLE